MGKATAIIYAWYFRMIQHFTTDEMRLEYTSLCNHLKSLNMEVALCHNDAWFTNILYDEANGTTTYSVPNSLLIFLKIVFLDHSLQKIWHDKDKFTAEMCWDRCFNMKGRACQGDLPVHFAGCVTSLAEHANFLGKHVERRTLCQPHTHAHAEMFCQWGHIPRKKDKSHRHASPGSIMRIWALFKKVIGSVGLISTEIIYDSRFVIMNTR